MAEGDPTRKPMPGVGHGARTHAPLPFEDGAAESDTQRISALTLEVAYLRSRLYEALVLERFWRLRAMFAAMPDRPDADEVT